MQGRSLSFSTLLLADAPEPHLYGWSWVRWSFSALEPNSLIAFCCMMFIGARSAPGILAIFLSRRTRLYTEVVSLSRSTQRRVVFDVAPLWLRSSFFFWAASSLSSQSEPCVRMADIHIQFG
eukprot:3230863-Ditylum_brightwellii.AAC.1